MNVRSTVARINATLKKIPTKIWLIGGGVLLVVFYGLLFILPQRVQFAYANETCVQQFTVAPGLHKATSDEFDIEFKGELRLGSVTLASSGMCLTPKTIPEAGEYTASVALFGGVIAAQQLRITVPEAPAVNQADLADREISTARPLAIRLSSGDVVHRYTLKVADKTAACEQSTDALSCDVPSLKLNHGTEYTAALHRTYKESEKKVAEGTLETLQPLALKKSTIKKGQTFYTKPNSASFTFDQAVAESDVTLTRTGDDTAEPIPLETTAEKNKITVKFDELPREASFKLTINQATGENGSALAKPVSYTFKTSGGPKVSSVSVGSGNVSRSATIIVTFDQPIDATVDVAKFARVEGVKGSAQRQSKTQFAFSISAGDCKSFRLVIDKGLKSGSNDELSKAAWTFNSRTTCGYSWSIGTSRQGRPIIAYSFGSGSKTILFTAAIHGSEPSSYATMLSWVTYLQANGHVVPADKRIVIVPNTNPDGIAVGSRNNSRNVNVGRNFPTANWQASIETASGTLPKGGGTSPGSEPEAAALIALTRQLRPRLEVSFHAQGSLVGANKFGDSVRIGNIYAATVGYATMYYNAEAVMGYPMTGEYEDWMGEEMGIPAILIELPTLHGNYFNSQLPALRKLLTI